jgi:hypothetical protein
LDIPSEPKVAYTFFYLPKEAGKFIRDLYGKPFGNKVIDDYFDKIKLTKLTYNMMRGGK